VGIEERYEGSEKESVDGRGRGGEGGRRKGEVKSRQEVERREGGVGRR